MSKIVSKMHYIKTSDNIIIRWLETNWGARMPQNTFGRRWLLEFRTSALPPPLLGRHFWWGRKNGVVYHPTLLLHSTHVHINCLHKQNQFVYLSEFCFGALKSGLPSPSRPQGNVTSSTRNIPSTVLLTYLIPTYCNIGPSPAVNFCIIRRSI